MQNSSITIFGNGDSATMPEMRMRRRRAATSRKLLLASSPAFLHDILQRCRNTFDEILLLVFDHRHGEQNTAPSKTLRVPLRPALGGGPSPQWPAPRFGIKMPPCYSSASDVLSPELPMAAQLRFVSFENDPRGPDRYRPWCSDRCPSPLLLRWLHDLVQLNNLVPARRWGGIALVVVIQGVYFTSSWSLPSVCADVL